MVETASGRRGATKKRLYIIRVRTAISFYEYSIGNIVVWGDVKVILINKARIMNPRDAKWTVIVT